MHAKHADSIRSNDLSRQVIGCVFTVLNTLAAGRQPCLPLDFGKPRLKIKRVVDGL
jgi:hypothetical protein